jgi:hypothetical protein
MTVNSTKSANAPAMPKTITRKLVKWASPPAITNATIKAIEVTVQ